MGRPERPLDLSAGPVHRFAGKLRELRHAAGGVPYRVLAKRANFSPTALSEAAGGETVPSLTVTLAYVAACGGDQAEWEARWRCLVAELAQAGVAAAVGADAAEPAGVVSPDGQHVANDHTVRIWEWAVSGVDPLVFRGFVSSVETVAFSSDGRSLASSRGNGSVLVWQCEVCGRFAWY